LGRNWLIPAGLAVAALSAATLIPSASLPLAALAVTTLSLGYDMTQPLLAGIVTSLDPKRGGQAMGLNVFALFTGFGVGSFLFGETIRLGLGSALRIFSAVQSVAGLAGAGVFHGEATSASRRTVGKTAAANSTLRP